MTKAEYYKAVGTNYTMVPFENAWELYEKLQAENERLKAEVKRLEDNEEFLANEQVKILDERDGLRKENAKLKCTVLHAISEYFGYKTLFSNKKTNRTKYGQFANKFYEAYRKAKKALREGK